MLLSIWTLTRVHLSYWSLIFKIKWVIFFEVQVRALLMQVAHLNTRPETCWVPLKRYVHRRLLHIYALAFRWISGFFCQQPAMRRICNIWSSTDLVAGNLLKMAAIWNVISGLIQRLKFVVILNVCWQQESKAMTRGVELYKNWHLGMF